MVKRSSRSEAASVPRRQCATKPDLLSSALLQGTEDLTLAAGQPTSRFARAARARRAVRALFETAASSVQGTRASSPGLCLPLSMAGLSQFIDYAAVLKATNNFTTGALGRGSYGTVYKGKLDGVEVAVKRLDGVEPSDVFQELEVAGKVKAHANLLRLLHAAVESKTVCLVYPLMAGDLHHALRASPPPDTAARLRILRDISAGLAALHAAKLVHRDLKPANILLAFDGTAKLADFGLAKAVGEGQLDVTTLPRGTKIYRDPEYNASSRLGASSDLYAVGVIVLELLTGELEGWSRAEILASNVAPFTHPIVLRHVNHLPPTLDVQALCAPHPLGWTAGQVTVLAGLAAKCLGAGSGRPGASEFASTVETLLPTAGAAAAAGPAQPAAKRQKTAAAPASAAAAAVPARWTAASPTPSAASGGLETWHHSSYGRRILRQLRENDARLTELTLLRHGLGTASAAALAEALKANTKLRVLDLDFNGIDNVGAAALAEALKVNKTLSTLRLDSNKIGDAGARALAEALKVNATLTELCLMYNIIKQDGARALTEALQSNTTLTYLDVALNFTNAVPDDVLQGLWDAGGGGRVIM